MSETFGPYELLDLLGQGGMGEVHRARDTVRERVVALKRLRPELADDDAFRARFRRESALAARLSEAHVVPIHDYGEIDGRLYLDMRLVEGRDLAQVLRAGPLPPQRAVEVVAQVASALDAAHAAQLVHRDVKPSNVLLEGATHAYLVDFGLVGAMDGDSMSLTATGALLGTLAYMAPERFSGTGDHRADVYSLACLLHAALTGKPPFTAPALAVMNAHLNQAPPRASHLVAEVPAALDDVVARGMAKEPGERFASAGALAAAARAAVSGGAGLVGSGLAGPDAVVAPPGSAPSGGSAGSFGSGLSGSAPSPGAAGLPWSASDHVRPGVVTGPPPWGWSAGPAPGPSGPEYPVVAALAPTLPSPRRRTPGRGRILLASAVVLIAAAAGVGATVFATPSVRAERADTVGEDPFTPPAAGTPMTLPYVRTSGVVAGDAPGLYGGTEENACDAGLVADFLATHPAQRDAWADAQHITPEQVGPYIAGLTPLILRSDTAVTNHGFRNGRANAFPAVLQSGTAVLVDEYGIARLRCFCGNPLGPADTDISTSSYRADWEGFDPDYVTVVTPAPKPIEKFVLRDLRSDEDRTQAAGDGAGDGGDPTSTATSTIEPVPTSEPSTVVPSTSVDPSDPSDPVDPTAVTQPGPTETLTGTSAPVEQGVSSAPQGSASPPGSPAGAGPSGGGEPQLTGAPVP